MSVNIPAIMKMLDLVEEQFGSFAYIEIFSDGSGFVRHVNSPKRSDALLHFINLGELAGELN